MKLTIEEHTLTRCLIAARRAVLTEFRPDSCIATTRVLVDVLDHAGIPARPLVVGVQAFNRTGRDYARRQVPQMEWPPSAWSVGVDPRAEAKPGGWSGHLVAVTQAHLLDGSLDQLHRPEKGLVLRPMVFRLPEGWDRRAPIGMDLADGSYVWYEPWRNGDPSWRLSTNWSRRTPAIERVTALAVAELGG